MRSCECCSFEGTVDTKVKKIYIILYARFIVLKEVAFLLVIFLNFFFSSQLSWVMVFLSAGLGLAGYVVFIVWGSVPNKTP